MLKSANGQKPKTASVVEMDAAKFLRQINVGAQSQLALFSERIETMGREVKANWSLVSLDGHSLIYEDTDRKLYYLADIKKLGQGRVKIENHRQIRVVESNDKLSKSTSFDKHLGELVDAIYENDNSKADKVFNRITHQRFRSTVIPESGWVVTRDGMSRYVPVAKTIVSREAKANLIDAICEALSENVEVDRGRIVEATFGDTNIKFPVSELTRRRVVARAMKEQAQKAYASDGFQARMKHIALLVQEHKVQDAVLMATKFLADKQEFCLLNLTEMRQLASDTMATQGCFNSLLSDDIGELLYRANCRVNRDSIIHEWRETAKLTEYAPLVENVRLLDESKDFEKDYVGFLASIFTEDMSTKAAKAGMYLSALKDMRNVLAKSESDNELINSLDEYIVRLESAGEEVDDATLMEVEELVASTSENLMKDVSSLADFDTIPEPAKAEPDMFGKQDLGGAGGGGAGGAGAGGLDLDVTAGATATDTDKEAGGEDLSLPLGAEEEAEEPAMAGVGEAKNKSGKTITEDEDEKVEEDDDGDTCEECGMAECACEGLTAEQITAVGQLDGAKLKLELAAWQKNGAKFFTENAKKSTYQLKAYIEHARYLKEGAIAKGFSQVLHENSVVDTGGINVNADPYAYAAPKGIKFNRAYGLKEDHDTWPSKMKQTKEGGQIGGKETAKGDAMGEQDEPENMIKKDAEEKEALLKKGGSKYPTKTEDIAPLDDVACPECNGDFDLVECMTPTGVVCPDCGADMSKQLMEALEIKENLKGAGHKMDRIGGDNGGVAKTSMKSSDGKGAGGSKEGMDGQDGKGVSAKSASQSNGAKAGGGKKDTMDQEGKGVAESTEEDEAGLSEVENGDVDTSDEDQYKSPTRRRRMAQPIKGRATLDKTEAKAESVKKDKYGNVIDEMTTIVVTDQPVDDVVSKIVATMGDEEDSMPPDEDEFDTSMDEMPPEGMGDEMPPDIGAGEAGGEGDAGLPPDIAGGADEDAGLPPDMGDEGPPEGLGDEGEEEEVEEVEEDESVGEGKLPEHLKKYMKTKKDGGDKGGDDEGGGEKKKGGKPWEKNEEEVKEETMKEDDDIGKPGDKDSDSADAARKDGDGKMMREKPKFTTKDYNGTKGAKTAKKS